MRENFIGAAANVGFRCDASKDMLKLMFNRVAYAPTNGEYMQALEELRTVKSALAAWIQNNEPKRWVQSKFRKNSGGKLNNNLTESWNKWM